MTSRTRLLSLVGEETKSALKRFKFSLQSHTQEESVPSEVEDRQKQRRETILECHMTVSQISPVLYSVESPVTHDDICLADPDQCHNAHESLEDEKCISREDKVSLVDLGDDDARRLAASFQNQQDQENTSSTHQHLKESSEGIENNKRTLNVLNINTVETTTSKHGDESVATEDVCEILEGKRLFEDDRKSRRFFMDDLQKGLKDKQQNQLNSNKDDSFQSNRADPYNVSNLQSSLMQNGSNCGNLEVPYQNPEALKPNPILSSRNVSTQENSHRISSHEGMTAKADDKLLRKHPLPQNPVTNNVRDCNHLEDVCSHLPKTTLERETSFAASSKSDSSSLSERKTYAENIETARNDVRSSKQNTINTNKQTPSRNQEVQNTLRVDEEVERETKPVVNSFKRRKHHSVEGSERIEVEITGFGTNALDNQEPPCTDYEDKATWKKFGALAGEVLTDSSMNNDTSRRQNNVVDLLNETQTVDGPNLHGENGMHFMKKREPTLHSKSKATILICNETTTRFLCQGSDVTDGDSHKDLAVDASVLAKHFDKDSLDFVFIPKLEVEDAIGVDREGQRQLKPHVSNFIIRKQDLEGRERSGVETIRRETNTPEKQSTSCSDHNEMTTERTFEALGSNQSNVVVTDFVDGPKLNEENGAKSLNQGLRAIEPTCSYGQIYFKSQATISNRYETSTRSMCQGGDVVADGESCEDSLNNIDTVDESAVTQNLHKASNAGERFTANMKHKSVISCGEKESDTDRDALWERRYPHKSKTEFFQSHSGDGGARSKQRSTHNAKFPLRWSGITNPISAYCDFELQKPGLDPVFMARHIKESSPFPSFHCGGNYNLASLDGPWQEDYEQEYSSSNGHDQVFKGKGQNSPDKKEFIQHDRAHKFNMRVPVYNASVTKTFSFYHVSPPNKNEKESWHFPSSESWEDRVVRSQCFAKRTSESNVTSLPKSFDANREKLFNTCGSVWAYNDMGSMANEYANSIANEGGQSLPLSENEHTSTEYSLASSFRRLQEIMARSIRLVVSNATGTGETQPVNQSVEKRGVQDETSGMGERKLVLTQQINETNSQVESTPSNEKTIEAERQPMATPLQESPRPVYSNYQRRCSVWFPCCGKLFRCHRRHNKSDCSEDQARAINAAHICYHKQEIDENGQRCSGCNAIMSEYFCPTGCFHCEKCGIRRIHRDRSFHCDVCNVCLDKRLEGKHKCRPDSGHDECCMCLEKPVAKVNPIVRQADSDGTRESDSSIEIYYDASSDVGSLITSANSVGSSESDSP